MSTKQSTNTRTSMITNRQIQKATRCVAQLIPVMAVVALAMACGADDDESSTTADAAVTPPADAETHDTWTSFASGFIETYCYECHGPGDSLRDYSLLATVQSEQEKIRCGVSPSSIAGCSIPAKQFPVGSGPKPNDAERQRLVDWIDSGAPN